MEDISLLFVDSKNRDKTLYPFGNSYTLHLTTPIRNVTRVDLVSANIPNTGYNLTIQSNIIVGTSNVQMIPGFYSPSAFVTEFNNSTATTANVDYSVSDGKFVFYGSALSNLYTSSAELARITGIPQSTLIVANTNTTNSLYNGSNVIRSSTITDLSTNDYLWLDIEELRTPSSLDAKKIVNRPLSNVISETPISTRITALVPGSSYITTTLTADVPLNEYTNSAVFQVASPTGFALGQQVDTTLVRGSVFITNITGNNITVKFDTQYFPGTNTGSPFRAIAVTASIQVESINGYVIGNQVVSPHLAGQCLITGFSGSNVIITYDAQPFPQLNVGYSLSVISGRTTSFQTYEGSTAATSFGMINMDVPPGSTKTFKELSDYMIINRYPSAVDLPRLTIQWLDINGLPVAFNGLENNSFTLRIHYLKQVTEKERPVTLPPPVDMGSGVPKNKRLIAWVAFAILVVGLLIITFMKQRKIWTEE
jgi:hypothetical protein